MKPNGIYKLVELMCDLSPFQIVLLIVTVVILWGAVSLKLSEKKVKMISLFGFIAGVFTIILLGLVNRVVWERRNYFIPFQSLFSNKPDGLQQFLLNVLFFIPVGITLPFLINEKTDKPRISASIFGFGLSLITELLQLALKRGVFETDDILANTFGAMIGTVSFWIYFRRRKT